MSAANLIPFPQRQSPLSSSQFRMPKPGYDKSFATKYKSPKSDEELAAMSDSELMDYYDLENHAFDCPCADCERGYGPSQWNRAPNNLKRPTRTP